MGASNSSNLSASRHTGPKPPIWMMVLALTVVATPGCDAPDVGEPTTPIDIGVTDTPDPSESPSPDGSHTPGGTSSETPTEQPRTPPQGPDADGDFSPDDQDCNDEDPSIYPEADELCDGIDQDCDGVADDGALSTFYYDGDHDGAGLDSSALQACSAPLGYVSAGGDCDDTNAALYPTALELCDGVDNDCDTQIDEETFTFYLDQDQDGFGTTDTSQQGSTVVACAPPAGYALTSDDCNDLNSTIFPGATETCDGADNNCDSQVDEGLQTPWYSDVDHDGYGAIGSTPIVSCQPPPSSSASADDCDDQNQAVNPGAGERCNGVDDNCNGEVDEAGAIDAPTWYYDQDLDTYGTATNSQVTCTQPEGFVTNDDDCNDVSAAVHPGATDACTESISNSTDIDDDCDGLVDEGSGSVCFEGGEVIISEIFYDATETEPNSEWFELYNTTSYTINLSGWKFSRTASSTQTFYIGDSVNILSHDTLVLCYGDLKLPANSCDYIYGSNQGFVSDLGDTTTFPTWSTFSLSNTGATLAVAVSGYGGSSQTAVTQDSVAYTNSSPWPVNSNGLSIELSWAKVTGASPATDNNNGANWALVSTAGNPYRYYNVSSVQEHGTPNAQNSNP